MLSVLNESAAQISTASRVSTMTPADAEAVSRLFRTVLDRLPYYNDRAKAAEVTKYSGEQLQALMSEDSGAVLVASVERELGGFCFLKQDDDTFWISWIGVHPDYRRCGIGRALLNAVEKLALSRGFHKIWCDSRTNNSDSKSLLTAQGYRKICAIQNHWYGQDFYLWEKFVT